MQQLKTSSTGQGTWDQVQHVLRDTAVDNAMESAKTDLLYKKLLEEEHKKWELGDSKQGIHPTIQNPSSTDHNKDIKKEIFDEDEHDDNIKETDNANNNVENEDTKNDLLFDDFQNEIDNDPVLKKLHEERLEQLKQKFKVKQERLAKGHGHYDEMDEKDALKMAIKTENVVVHFYADDFERCRIFDEHLKRLAVKHIDAKFVRCNARKSPFLVDKWKIRTLPTICIVIGSYLVDKIIGFSDLGDKDDFPTIALEKRLSKSGVIKDVDGKKRKKVSRTKVLTDLM